MLISIMKEDKYMKLIVAIILSLLLVGCLSSQGQSPDYKVGDQEVQKQGESRATHANSLKEREKVRQSSQY
jgi:outer membrane biogenesis lipoprotein LolB